MMNIGRQILIKAIKNGYKDVVVKRIRTGIIKRNGDPSERNISGRRQKILITQIARIQPTNPSLEPPK